MSNETTATETKTETIATPQEVVATPNATEVDYEAVLKQKDEELAQVAKEKENYRKAYLKNAPAQPEEDDNSSETTEQMIRRVTREELLSTKEAQLRAEKDATITALVRRNKEYETALKNRSQLSPSGTGSNQDKPEGKVDNYLSNDQVTYFKTKLGWDDKKIEAFKKNMTKVNEMPRL